MSPYLQRLFAHPPSFANSKSVEDFVGQARGFAATLIEANNDLVRDMERTLFDVQQLQAEIDQLGTETDGLARKPVWADLLPWFFPLSLFPTDIVIAVVVIACGAIKSLFAGLRLNAPSPWLRAPFGAAAGFIAFLILKGGKFFFLVQLSPEGLPLNPYACAFTGILAGLFTERAYALLQSVFNMLADQTEQTVANGAAAVLKGAGDERDVTPADKIQPVKTAK